uniref:Adenylyl-sulfate kinase n=1 Tax=Ditylenchus dipsaci TaxID=166011 RepID=A0A915DGV3_9BILA
MMKIQLMINCSLLIQNNKIAADNLLRNWQNRDSNSEIAFQGLLVILEYCLQHSFDSTDYIEKLVNNLGNHTFQFWKTGILTSSIQTCNTEQNTETPCSSLWPSMIAKRFGEQYHHLQQRRRTGSKASLSLRGSNASLRDSSDCLTNGDASTANGGPVSFTLNGSSTDKDLQRQQSSEEEERKEVTEQSDPHRRKKRSMSIDSSSESDGHLDDATSFASGGLAQTHFEQRVINVSNAPPVSLTKGIGDKSGEWEIKQGSGGLVSCVDPVMSVNHENVWLANLGMNIDKCKLNQIKRQPELGRRQSRSLGFDYEHFGLAIDASNSCRCPKIVREEMSLLGVLSNYNRANYKLNPIVVQENDYQVYYGGITNGLLWPALHNLPEYILSEYDDSKVLREHCVHMSGSTISLPLMQSETIVRRTHLMLTGMIMQSMDSKLEIDFFLHIPLLPPVDIIMDRKHEGFTLWFTGLSGAGKTTISFALEKTLIKLGLPAYGLDGDNVRHGLCKNLGFKDDDRAENIRRVAELSKLFADMGIITLVSFISPFRQDREEARLIHENQDIKFFEIHVNTSIDVCEARIQRSFINAGAETKAQSIQTVLQFLYENNVIPEKAMYELCGQPVHELFCLEDQKTDVASKTSGPSIEITDVDLQWLQVLSEGWATPLSGFMRERQYLQCLHYGQIFDLKKGFEEETAKEDGQQAEAFPLLDSLNQSIPIVLPIDDVQKAELTKNVLIKAEIYPHRKQERIHRQFGYSDSRHPAINLINDSGDWLIGGDLEVVERVREAKCDAVFAFQLRNPIHNGHALLMQETRQQLLKRYKNPMLLLHPLGGWTKKDDVPLAVRIEQHKAVIDAGVLDSHWTVLAIFPSPMLYAGPTEVQWHARARMACGVNAYIVGRDPAGIQNLDTKQFLYDPTHGQKVLSMAPGLKKLEIIPFRTAVYDKLNKKMAFRKESCQEDFLSISGTLMRQMAKEGKEPPEGFMVPKAWEILSSHYRNIGSAVAVEQKKT